MAMSNPFEKKNAPKAPTAKRPTLTASKAPAVVPLINTKTQISATDSNNNISEDDTYPVFEWHGVLDIVEEINEKRLTIYYLVHKDIIEALSYNEAKVYLDSFVEHGSENEIKAVVELLKIHSKMKHNLCKYRD